MARDADRRGKARTVGEWALYIQCSWRFVRGRQIVVASGDLNRYAVTDEPFDWRGDEESRFDRLTTALNTGLAAVPHHVAALTDDTVDGFRLAFDPELGFEVFPCAATFGSKYEFWRIFQPATHDRHIVFGTGG